VRELARSSALVLAVLALFAAPAGALAVRDMLGRSLTLPALPERVVSLDPSVTEIIFAVGGAARLAGVTDYCDYPAAARAKPHVGDLLAPSLEAIVALRPDLVIATTEGNSHETVEALERVGVRVYLTTASRLADVGALIDRIGELTGQTVAAAALRDRLDRRVGAVRRAVAGRSRPRVLYVLWPDPLLVPGRGTLLGELIGVAGGESVTAGDATEYPRLSLEAAVARRPDVVVVANHGGGGAPVERWSALEAVLAARAARVASVDGNLLHRHGPRIADGLEALARLLHPEAFR
jgi:iron complex transport system substrate-binding protein